MYFLALSINGNLPFAVKPLFRTALHMNKNHTAEPKGHAISIILMSGLSRVSYFAVVTRVVKAAETARNRSVGR